MAISQARLESNAWIEAAAKYVTGNVLSIGSGSDLDGQGRKYRQYFSKTESYQTSEVSLRATTDLVLDVRNMEGIEDGEYDCVFCSGVLEHVDDLFGAMREIARILRTGGVLLLGVPLAQKIHRAPQDFWRMTIHGVRYLLENNGFKAALITPIAGPEDFPATYWAKGIKL
jgi:SAM-dependent methyltransferase